MILIPHRVGSGHQSVYTSISVGSRFLFSLDAMMTFKRFKVTPQNVCDSAQSKSAPSRSHAMDPRPTDGTWLHASREFEPAVVQHVTVGPIGRFSKV